MNKDYLQAKKKIRTLVFERKQVSNFHAFFHASINKQVYSLLLDSIHRLGNNNTSISDDSETDNNSEFSDTDDEVDGKEKTRLWKLDYSYACCT